MDMSSKTIQEYLIYQSEITEDDLEAAKVTLETDDESAIYEEASFSNRQWMEDEKVVLDIEIGAQIILIADLGLWFGRRQSSKILGTNLNAIFRFLPSDGNVCFYADRESGDIVCRSTHHDGTNYFRYRKVNPGQSIEDLVDLLYSQCATEADIQKYTTSILPEVAKVYGWSELIQEKKEANI